MTLNSKSNTKSISRSTVYADFDLGMTIHPILKDIRPLYDLDAVKMAIKNLVLTGGFDRPFHPELGGNVSGYLFENANRFTLKSLQTSIETNIRRYEERVSNVVVTVEDQSDINAFNVTVQFKIKSSNEEGDISFFLERLR